MNEKQLSRLAQLTDLFEKCAKMGGTKGFERIQPLVAEALGELLDEIDPPKKAVVHPEPETMAYTAGSTEADQPLTAANDVDVERRV